MPQKARERQREPSLRGGGHVATPSFRDGRHPILLSARTSLSVMPLLQTAYPTTLSAFYGPAASPRSFIIYYASIDPATGMMWCPDCRAVEETVKKAFAPSDGPMGLVIYVGGRAEWKDTNNEYRKQGITNVPTIVRIKDGKEVGRLVEGEILDEEKLSAFVQ